MALSVAAVGPVAWSGDLEPFSIDTGDLLVENIDFRQEFKTA
jgi:hypothetical protein